MKKIFAERIGGEAFGRDGKVYKFEKIKRAKHRVLEDNPEVEILDFGIGEPNAMPFPETIEALKSASEKPENNGYADNGGRFFKEAIQRYMEREFAVDLGKSEVLHTMGTKTALGFLALALINSGDVVIVTTPGYPVFGTHAGYLGGEVFSLPLEETNDFLPDLDSVPQDIAKKAKVLLLNYPNNPTGASATFKFFQKCVDWARANDVLIMQDAAYASLVHEGKALSILQVPGAKDVAVELHSMSKAFNMTGWRIGWICGNASIIEAFAHIKSNSDSGQFLAIQEAAAKTLAYDHLNAPLCEKYKRRKALLLEILAKHGFLARNINAGFFLYARAPKTVRYRGETHVFENAEQCSLWLLENLHILTVPWDEADPYLRFSLTFNCDDEKPFFEDLTSRLSEVNFMPYEIN